MLGVYRYCLDPSDQTLQSMKLPGDRNSMSNNPAKVERERKVGVLFFCRHVY
jgi:hypothetical protein